MSQNGNGRVRLVNPVNDIIEVLHGSDNSGSIDVYINPEHYKIFKNPDVIREFRGARNREIAIRMVCVDLEGKGALDLTSVYRSMGVDVRYLTERGNSQSFVVHEKGGVVYFS